MADLFITTNISDLTVFTTFIQPTPHHISQHLLTTLLHLTLHILQLTKSYKIFYALYTYNFSVSVLLIPNPILVIEKAPPRPDPRAKLANI